MLDDNVYRSLSEAAQPAGQGYRHSNSVVTVDRRQAGHLKVAVGSMVKLRERLETEAVIPFDPVVWEDESATLDWLSCRFDGDGQQHVLPRVIGSLGNRSVQTFKPGTVLTEEWSDFSRLPEHRLSQLAGIFGALAEVPWEGEDRASRLPLPEGWPKSWDSSGFLRWQISYTRERVERASWALYGDVLDALGCPTDIMDRFEETVPDLTPRPFVFLHGDLHPGNLIKVSDASLAVIDWELAMIGDPVHELAIHLERSRYRQRRAVARLLEAWKERVGKASADAVAGVDRDLDWYRRFQCVRSVYTDVVRTVERHVSSPGEYPKAQADTALRQAVLRARNALEPAARPVLAPKAVRRALERRWVAPLLHKRGCILFDFDGPICQLFSGLSAASVATQLLADLARIDLLPKELTRPTHPACRDPHLMFRTVGELLKQEGRTDEEARVAELCVDRGLSTAELRAAGSADPTEGAIDLIRELIGRRFKVAIVSNNSASAINEYLRIWRCDDAVPPSLVFGRPDDPLLMKPHEHLLELAMDAHGVTRDECLFLGDSVADAYAAANAKIAFLGYDADRRYRRDRLARAGIDECQVIGSLEPIRWAVQHSNGPAVDDRSVRA